MSRHLAGIFAFAAVNGSVKRQLLVHLDVVVADAGPQLDLSLQPE